MFRLEDFWLVVIHSSTSSPSCSPKILFFCSDASKPNPVVCVHSCCIVLMLFKVHKTNSLKVPLLSRCVPGLRPAAPKEMIARALSEEHVTRFVNAGLLVHAVIVVQSLPLLDLYRSLLELRNIQCLCLRCTLSPTPCESFDETRPSSLVCTWPPNIARRGGRRSCGYEVCSSFVVW